MKSNSKLGSVKRAKRTVSAKQRKSTSGTKHLKKRKSEQKNLKGTVKKVKHRASAFNTNKQSDEQTASISSELIKQAIEGVRMLEKQLHAKTEKGLLDDDDEDGLISMQVGIVKVTDLLPVKHIVRPVKIRVHLPHSFVNNDTEVLLITRDEDSKKKRQLRQDFSEHLNKFQEMLRMCGASKHINEVMTLRQLKVEYKEYEAKRHLANRVDVVLVDDTIVRRIPMFLGKHFYKKKKIPIQVNLKAKNVLAEVEKALAQTVLWLPMTGNSALMTIGRLSQPNEMIEQNIRAVLKKFQEKFPGGWANIQNLSLKSMKSKSVPFYAKLSSANDIQSIAPKPLYARRSVVGEVSTYLGKPVRVYPDGTFKEVTRKDLKKAEIFEKKMELEAEKAKSKKKSSRRKADLLSKKKKADAEGDGISKKKLKLSNEEGTEETNTKSTYDSMDVEDLDKMEMEYLRRISLKKEEEKKEGKSSKIVPEEDSDDAWAEFSDDEILSDIYDDEL